MSFFLGDSTQAIIIGVILLVSIGLGFVNEYRAERATAALHSAVRHNAVVRRDGRFVKVDVNHLVPGDVIRLALGEVGARRRAADRCQRSGMQRKHPDRRVDGVGKVAAAGHPPTRAWPTRPTWRSWAPSSARARGSGWCTPPVPDAEFGRIAAGLGERQPETDFQVGLRRFSYLLLRVAIVADGAHHGHQPVVASAGDRLGAVRVWRSRSASRRSCCPRSSAPAWRPGRGGWRGSRCWSNDWCALRTLATSTS